MRNIARIAMLLSTVVLACTAIAPTAVASFPTIGTVTRYNLPDDALLGGFAVAPDGSLWFPQVHAITTIDPRSGTQSSIPVFAEELVAGPDGDMWFHNYSRIGRIDPRTAKVVRYPTPGHIVHEGPIVGSDGNMWFAGRHLIGRITPSGALTSFPFPSGVGRANDLVLGADGNIWFQYGHPSSLDSIGRITPSGDIALYQDPPVVLQVSTLVVGPDGNVWFLRFTHRGERLGYVTPSGAFGSLPLPTNATNGVQNLVVGPDGNFWFTDNETNSIGRITLDGKSTEFPVTSDPCPSYSPCIHDLTAGADGALWFTASNHRPDANPRVGRITTSGDITEYPTPGSGFPTEIRLGPDGNMWAEDVFHTLAYLRVQAAAQHTSYVMNESLVFLPHSQTVRLGNTVRWTLGSPMTQEISDASGLDLYDSGPLGFVSTFDHPFSSSGSYPFEDRLHPLAAGSIDVPVLLRTGAGAEDARVTWATEPPPPGLVFDVQVEQPGAAHFVHWKTTASVEHAWFRPGDPKYTSDGEYSFRARLLDPQSGHATAFSSPATTIPLG